MKNNRKAVTLIEVSIGIVLSALLLGGVLNLFTSGMKGSAKGLTHQDNMETAYILMTQIEYDLLRATKIESPGWDQKDDAARWFFQDSENGVAKEIPVIYSNNGTDGIIRDIDGKKMYYAKGHPVELRFTHFAVDTGLGKESDLLVEKHGMWVELIVYSKSKKESFKMNRLIVIRRPF